MQKCRLHPGLWQEELRDAKAAIDRSCDGGRKHIGPRAAAEAGGFGVDVRDVAGVRVQARKGNDVLADGR
jgi:hypothetical protein